MQLHTRNERPSRAHGQVLVLFALASFVLIGFMALAVDVGFLLTERRSAQNIADAAALAGAHALWQEEGHAGAENTADAYATLNGADASTTVIPVATGDHTGGTVTVTVQQPVQEFFLGAIYTGSWEVSARAVAAIRDVPNSGVALLALNETPGMEVHGEIRVTVHDGSAMSNGDILRSGAPNVFKADGSISAAGTVNDGPYWDAGDGINNAVPQVEDPLASIPPPSPPAEVVELADVLPCHISYEGSPADCILPPGYYKDLGQIVIKRTAYLQPGGLYYFEGTSISLEGMASRIEGEGVMLYFAEGASPATTYFDPANSEGGVYLTAPATSPYEGGLDGMTLWIDNCSEFTVRGSGEFYIEGVLYAPCSDVEIHGNPNGDAVNGQIIVGNLTLRGTVDLSVRYHDYVDISRRGVFLIE